MKVMISQPMINKTDKEILDERQETAEHLEKLGHEVVDTLFQEEPEKGQNAGLFYLAKSIDAMSKVDAMYFIEGWEKARGCNIEYNIAKEYRVKILHE